MARVTIFLILFIVATILFLYYDNGGNNDVIPQPPLPEQPDDKDQQQPDDKDQQWQVFINIQKALGHEVLSIAASQRWIEKHSDEIRIPNQIEFAEQHIVSELPFTGTMIAVDANDKRRVIRWPDPPDPPGHLSEDKSLEWLSENGYEVEKSENGSTTIKKGGRTIINIGGVLRGELEKGVSFTAFDGKIYIENGK